MKIGRTRFLILPLLALAVPCAHASADPSVTIIPPSGPQVRAYPNDLRTTDPQPAFAILGSGGSQLSCNIDNQSSGGQFTFGPCGQAPISCVTDVCAVYHPSTPLSNGQHELLAYLGDTTTSQLAQADVSFDVDTTPPNTSLGGPPLGPILRPEFDFLIFEDDQFARNDIAQCSFTRLGAAPAWSTCATGLRSRDGGTFRVPAKLPARHIDYRFEVRGVDDFGRVDPTPAVKEVDPVPCALKTRSISIGALIAHGIPVVLHCSYAHDVQLDFFLLGANGKRRSINYATNNYPNLGFQEIKKSSTHYTLHTTLKMFKDNDPYFRAYRSAALVVRVQDLNDTGTLADYSVITVRR